MEKLFEIDWKSVFVPDVSLWETFIRGTVVYLSIFIILRFVLKRQAGTVGITDLLVVVLISDAAQNAIAADYHSIPNGIFLVLTIVFWSFFLDWLGYRFPRLQRLIHPPPLSLVEHGKIMRRNMRQELLTEGELMTQLRQQGVDDLMEVKMAYMEGDGRISVITYEQKPRGNQKNKAV
ncbi:MAG: DUF421 domain-containing protein [Leptolyngbyaceae cyanobacterium bins.59]|nr:DUF421 domain-containing protein [Leptolyngbyaceae cyanobacterium bins.59]